MDGQLQSASRNITEVFIFLRNNARSTIHDYTFNGKLRHLYGFVTVI